MAEIFIEAAFNSGDGSNVAHFFLGNHFVSYDWNTDRIKDGVHHVSEWGFPASFVPTNLNGPLSAAIKGKGQFSSKVYFFKGQFYSRFNMTDKIMETSVPSPLSAWNFPENFTGTPEAAFNGNFSRDKKAYFFIGSQYIRYDWTQDQVDVGFPKPISNMMGIPTDFASGLDGAVDGDGPFSDFGYLFKNNRYLRFNWNRSGGEPFGDGSSSLINENWKGLIELLLVGKAISEATIWIEKTVFQLTTYAAALSTGMFFGDKELTESALSAHFHINPALSLIEKSGLITTIISIYANILATFQRSATVFRFRTNPEAIADLVPKINAAYTFFNSTVNFTQNYFVEGPHSRTAILIHETVHFIDNVSGNKNNHIPEWYVTDANALTLGLSTQPENTEEFGSRYDLMNTENAMHNPCSFAALAQHIFFGNDTRFGAGRPGL